MHVTFFANLSVGVQLRRHGDDGGGGVEVRPAVHLLDRRHAQRPLRGKVVDVLLLVGALLRPSSE